MRSRIKCNVFTKGTQMAEKHFKENYSDISRISYQNEPRSIKQITAYVGKDVGVRRTLIHCGWECKLWISLSKSTWQFLIKTRINLLQDQAIPLLPIFSNGYILLQRHLLICIHCHFIHNIDQLETALMSTSRCLDNKSVIQLLNILILS